MNPYLVAGAELAPVALERMLHSIPEDRFDETAEPGRFTVREVVAHLADWEPILRARMEGALRQPGYTVEVFDEGLMAIRHGYSDTDVWQQLQLWKNERERTVSLIRELSKEDMLTPLVHPERGEQTVGEVAHSMNGHDIYHLEQLTAFLPQPD